MPRSAAAGFVLAATGIVLIVAFVAACSPSAPPSGSTGARSSVPAPSTGGASGAPGASATVSPDGSGSAAASPAGSEPAETVWLPEWAGEDVPEPVAARRALPFCGVERAPAPQPGIFVDRAVRLCFWNAHLAHQEAEFVSLQTTMEGAPIAAIYRLAGDGTVQVLTDMTQDQFGGGAWTLQNCARVVAAEGQELLGVEDCVDGGPLE